MFLLRTLFLAVIVAADVDAERVSALEAAGMLVLRAVPAAGGGWGPSNRHSVLFKLEACAGRAMVRAAAGSPLPSSPQDHVLVLFTSGTSGNKKIVPYTLETIVIGAVCVAASWCLSPQDVNLNMMPLYHVGGACPTFCSPPLALFSLLYLLSL